MKFNSSESSSNRGSRKYVKRTTTTSPGKCEEDINVEAEKFIKKKLKHILVDDDVGAQTDGIVEQKQAVISKQEHKQDDIYIDVKAEEFIKQKKLELRRVSLNVG
ncbi:uncharacterized protein LOC125499041 [Beta vulgaris subsp. vulgaris]|uniref:uncharacterized protein LOC125499041 n=1 Tax=Beta vulgaris subsp. vulgaris TaxID=3555 RepID=UPI002036BA2E|nr:uncharacterized protein LOC125499041 [Beta vulgaris subsp. vulgaris]